MDLHLESIRRISHEIDKRVEPGALIFSDWAAYMVESHAATLPGTEIEYAQFISHALSDEQHRRYRILSNRSIEAAISNHVPRLVVLFDPHGPFVLAARNAGYRPVFALGRVTISERSQERF